MNEIIKTGLPTKDGMEFINGADLQYAYQTDKVNFNWFSARIRLAGGTIFREQGLQGFCAFWESMMTSRFSIQEHNLRNDSRTPNRCPFCGCPVELKSKVNILGYCRACDEMLDIIIREVPDGNIETKNG